MTARSVLASALLGEDPPELPVAHLVHLAGLFGINPNRARVALSRMVASGEATTDGAGRYRLAGRLLERRDRQEDSLAGGPARGRAGGGWSWSPRPGSSAEQRAARRRRLALARLAEQREGVWLRPDNLDLRPDPADDPDLVVYDGGARRRPGGTWPPRCGTSTDGRTGPGHCSTRLGVRPTAGPDDLAPGFELSAAVLRHLQSDPLLPADAAARRLAGPGTADRPTSAWDRRYRAVLRAWGRPARTA